MRLPQGRPPPVIATLPVIYCLICNNQFVTWQLVRPATIHRSCPLQSRTHIHDVQESLQLFFFFLHIKSVCRSFRGFWQVGQSVVFLISTPPRWPQWLFPRRALRHLQATDMFPQFPTSLRQIIGCESTAFGHPIKRVGSSQALFFCFCCWLDAVRQGRGRAEPINSRADLQVPAAFSPRRVVRTLPSDLWPFVCLFGGKVSMWSVLMRRLHVLCVHSATRGSMGHSVSLPLPQNTTFASCVLSPLFFAVNYFYKLV